ncbi:sensor histidine kinase [Comamonas sp. J-3]|uniref:sensor histidine kinase n=1 Tax=Comamonas trifloxystrobinivorans TaxID=3350256 RepID=UPI00372A72FF
MARGLNRIWVRFGLWIAGTVLSTMALLSLSAWGISKAQDHYFYQALPESVRAEFEELTSDDMVSDPQRVIQIYTQYWPGGLLFSDQVSLLVGLSVCLPFGLAVGFWVSRYVTRPLASIVEVAQRVERGDFGARAVVEGSTGEMADVVLTFNKMVDSLQELESERLATAASISHELRTPLSVLKAHLHAICDEVIEPSAQEFQALLTQTEHLGRLVDDLHTLSIADAGKISLQKQRLNLAALVAEVLEQLQPQLQAAGMQAQLSQPEDEQASDIRADPDRMRQIVFNLVSNAIRHAREGHWLGLSIACVAAQADEDEQDEGPWVQLQVDDAGPGLPQELRAHPFQRFAQAPGRRRREGSGLGLSIVRVLTEAQGGQVQAGSSERGGARFTLRFAQA